MLSPLQSCPDLDCRMILRVTLFKQVASQGLLMFTLMLAPFPPFSHSWLGQSSVCWVGKQVCSEKYEGNSGKQEKETGRLKEERR